VSTAYRARARETAYHGSLPVAKTQGISKCGHIPCDHYQRPNNKTMGDLANDGPIGGSSYLRDSYIIGHDDTETAYATYNLLTGLLSLKTIPKNLRISLKISF